MKHGDQVRAGDEFNRDPMFNCKVRLCAHKRL